MADIMSARQGTVLHLRLNRPGKRNALTDAMFREIADTLMSADGDSTVSAVVIEGEGGDFCAGNDLGMIADMAAGRVAVEDLSVDYFLEALSTFAKPLLAGVTGRAIGVGATLLLHCDVVYVADDAKISFPFVDLSLVPEAASTYLVPARIGYARAYRLLCMAQPISGREAAEIGLFTAAVETSQVSTGIAAVAQRLAEKPADALRATKHLIRDKDAVADALARDRAVFIERLKTFDTTSSKRHIDASPALSQARPQGDER